jgi:ankyrin repeat protein
MPAFFFFSSPPSFLRLDAISNADEDGTTALALAALGGHLPIVNILLRSEAEINTKGKTPLHCGLKCVGFIGKMLRA